MHQRAKIQKESLYHEELKHKGLLPIVGVNTFLAKDDAAANKVPELIRSTPEEKQMQLDGVRAFQKAHADETPAALKRLQALAAAGGNVFAELMETVKVASLGQISRALYEVGGQCRRAM